MKFYQETTVWKDSIANHIYLLDQSKSTIYAYVKAGSKDVFKFKNPIRIDTRGRKFIEVKNTFGYKIQKEKIENPHWIVTGSKGDKYTVEQTPNGFTCTCSGFKFRAKCKHIDSIDK